MWREIEILSVSDSGNVFVRPLVADKVSGENNDFLKSITDFQVISEDLRSKAKTYHAKISTDISGSAA